MGEIGDTFPVLESKRLKLVEIKQEYLRDLFALFGDPKVTEYYNIKTFKEVRDAQIYLEWFSSRYQDRLGIRWGISIQGLTGIIGTIGFNNFTENHRATLGYDLQSAYWNKGYMTEALKMVLDFGFNSLNINRIDAEVMVGNAASEKVLSKAGFCKEGILRDWMFWNKRHYDMAMYAYLKRDYPACLEK